LALPSSTNTSSSLLSFPPLLSPTVDDVVVAVAVAGEGVEVDVGDAAVLAGVFVLGVDAALAAAFLAARLPRLHQRTNTPFNYKHATIVI
jgi:DUF1009 family protein